MNTDNNQTIVKVNSNQDLSIVCDIIMTAALHDGPIQIAPADLFATLIGCKNATFIQANGSGENNISEALTGLNSDLFTGASKVMIIIFINRDDKVSTRQMMCLTDFLGAVPKDVSVCQGVLFDDDLEENDIMISIIIGNKN